MKAQVCLLIIDDNRLFAESVASLLSRQDGITQFDCESVIIDTITTIGEILNKIQALPADFLLINAGIVAGNASRLTGQIRSEMPDLKIIILGLDYSEQSIMEFVEAGASGYVLKEASFEELLYTIKTVAKGRVSCSPQVAAMIFARITELSQEQSIRARLLQTVLTPREKSILELIALGLGNKEIAEHLHISLYTVKNHVHNILDKLKVKYRREAIRLGFESGLLKQRWPKSSLGQGISNHTTG
jgi:DNA-binding NarL/FixJ family response regulator